MKAPTGRASNLFTSLSARRIRGWVSVGFDSTCAIVESGIVLSALTGSSDEPEMGVTAFRLYPNPATDLVNVIIELGEVSALPVRLISTLGNTVIAYPEVRTSRLSEAIPAAHLPAGLYCLQVEVDGRVMARSFIVDTQMEGTSKCLI